MERKERGGFFLCLLWHMILHFLWTVPAWTALALHFTVGTQLLWFWVALGVWFLAVVLRTLLVMFARYGASHTVPSPANKNPYSKTVRDPYAAMREEQA